MIRDYSNLHEIDNDLLLNLNTGLRNSISKKINKKEPWKISSLSSDGIRSYKKLKHQIKRRKLNRLSNLSKKINRNK